MRPATSALLPAALLAFAAGLPAPAEAGPGLLTLRNDSGKNWQFVLNGLGDGVDPGRGTVRAVRLLANGSSHRILCPPGELHTIELPPGSRLALRFTEDDERNLRGGNLVAALNSRFEIAYPVVLENSRLRLSEDGPFKEVSGREGVIQREACACSIL